MKFLVTFVPLAHVRTELKILKESNVLIQVIVKIIILKLTLILFLMMIIIIILIRVSLMLSTGLRPSTL